MCKTEIGNQVVKAAEAVPKHLAIIMDGNGRWANAQGIPRTEGHKAGEAALLDVIAGAIELGIEHLSVYAFSTENWRRSLSEVRFLMGFSRQVLRRQRDTLHSWNVRIKWVGKSERLWPSVLRELRAAEEITCNNTGLTLYMCINYGGRAELVDAVNQAIELARNGKIEERKLTEESFSQFLYCPQMPPVDLIWRTGGESRTSNFLPWQAVYAEIIISDVPWPMVNRTTVAQICAQFANRERRYGGAIDQVCGK